MSSTRLRGETFDKQPMPDFGSEVRRFRAASESFAQVRRLRERDLDTLRLLTDYQGSKGPAVGGVLLFGVDRDRYFPDGNLRNRVIGRVFQALGPIEQRGRGIQPVIAACGGTGLSAPPLEGTANRFTRRSSPIPSAAPPSMRLTRSPWMRCRTAEVD